MTSNETEGSKQPRILRGVVDSLLLYEVTDYELDMLEQGSPNSIFLNFAVFFLSTAISFSAALATVKIDSVRTFLVFVVITVIGWVVGLVCLLLWYRNRSHVSLVIAKIKARVEVGSAENQSAPTRKAHAATESSS